LATVEAPQGVAAKRPAPQRIRSGWRSRARAASFISLASTLRVRYSGVRPTMSPAMKTATTMNRNMLMNPTPTPPNATLSHMPASGTRPVKGFRLSCMASTEPFEVAVVETAQSGPAAAPKRSSLPSRFGAEATGRWAAARAGAGAFSRRTAALSPATRRTPITAKTTRASRRREVRRPNIQTQAMGMRRIATFSTTLLANVGFSNGWAELGPK
jgi:hypothetical protein